MMSVNLRTPLAQHLQQRLDAFQEGFRHNLAMTGLPGSGKTFQLQTLLSRHPAHMMVVYCPMYRESSRSLLHRFLGAIVQAGMTARSASSSPSPRSAGETHLEPLEQLLEQAQTLLPKTVAAVRPIEQLLSRRVYSEAFNRTLDTIPVLMEECQQPCVLILDEFLALEESGFTHAFHELGKRVMTWPTTLFILSSSSPYRARVILRERLQLLFGQFELLSLDALEPQNAAAWVQQELRGLKGAKALSPFLVRWLGASPWYLSVFLKRLKEVAALRDTAELTEALFFQTAWDVLGSPEGPLHQSCAARMDALVHLRHGARALEALSSIATGARTSTDIGRRIGRADLAVALQLLVEHDVVQRKGTCWLIPDPILRCWLTAILPAQRASGIADRLAQRARFEQYLSGTWRQWLHVSQLSFPEQVTRLFTNFRDDTMSIDSKTGRLPRFQTVTAQRPPTPSSEMYLVADGAGKRWCCTLQEGVVDENAIANFDAFCRTQSPKPSRKVVIARSQIDDNARLLAKAHNMWVWASEDLNVLLELYGQGRTAVSPSP